MFLRRFGLVETCQSSVVTLVQAPSLGDREVTLANLQAGKSGKYIKIDFKKALSA